MTGLLIGGSVWRYRKWLVDNDAEEKRWGKRCVHVHDVVVGSRLFSRELLDQVASDYLEKRSKTDKCDWVYYPTWHGYRKNPNWFSKTYGSDGMNVICETSAKHEDGSEDQLVFEWDVYDDNRIVGFKWRYYQVEYDQ
jgi:hypothetical protein